MKNGMDQDLLDSDVGTLLHLFAQNGAVDSVEKNVNRLHSIIESKTPPIESKSKPPPIEN